MMFSPCAIAASLYEVFLVACLDLAVSRSCSCSTYVLHAARHMTSSEETVALTSVPLNPQLSHERVDMHWNTLGSNGNPGYHAE